MPASKTRKVSLDATEALVLATHNAAKRKYYTAKRLGELAGISTAKARKAADALVESGLMVESNYTQDAEGEAVDIRYGVTEDGADVAVAMQDGGKAPKAPKAPKARKAVEQDEDEDETPAPKRKGGKPSFSEIIAAGKRALKVA